MSVYPVMWYSSRAYSHTDIDPYHNIMLYLTSVTQHTKPKLQSTSETVYKEWSIPAQLILEM